MINYFSQLVCTLMDRILGRPIFDRDMMRTLDLSDTLKRGDCRLKAVPAEKDEEFRIYSSTEDYNRDFLRIFDACRRDILLDYSHKDGHFRV